MMRAVVAALLLAAGLLQSDAADPTRTPIMQNETLAVTHLRFGPGTREAVHTHPFPVVLVQITPGQISVQEQNTIRRGNHAGEVWFVPTDRPHAVTSQAGATEAVDMLAIALLPNRPPAAAAPPTEAPPGITRATLVDNKDLRVVRVRFSPKSREPLHTHPNDLLTVQITPGKVEIINGPDDKTLECEPGFVQFLPRNVQHSYVSADTKPFELLSIAVK